MESRWQVLNQTSPSGKTLFRCLVCKRISPSPDKACPTMDCAGIEERLRSAPRDLRFEGLEDLKRQVTETEGG